VKDFDIYLLKQTEAISDRLNNSDTLFHRKICCWYSRTYFTPLHLVLDGLTIPWDVVLQHYYDNNIEKLSYNEVLELAKREYLPDLKEEVEKEDEELDKKLEKEQTENIKKRKSKQNQIVTSDKKKLQSLNSNDSQPLGNEPKEIRLNFEE
jgi:hypothetical protein